MQRQTLAPRPGDFKGEGGERSRREDAPGTHNETGAGSFSRGGARRHMAVEEYAVDWNGRATEPPPRLRLLLLADVDLASAKRVVEWALQGEKAFDLCAVCGDFVPRPEGWSTAGETEEKLSAEEGEMSATLAQLENTVCRVVYIPGPLDPVMTSIRLSRTQSSKGAAAAAATSAGGLTQGLLQLTPTSKNLHRRNLRLAPGLSMAGFTEEAHQRISSSSFSIARKRDGGGAGGLGGGDKFADDQTYSTLRSLCRSGGSKSRNSNNTNNIANHSSSGSGGGGGALTVRKTSPPPPPPPESVILMTRLGGAQRRRRRRRRRLESGAENADDADGSTAAADEEHLKRLDELNQSGAVPLRPPYCARAAVTAARLQHLWAQEQDGAAAATKGTAAAAANCGDSSEGRVAAAAGGSGSLGRGGGVLLHVCAGPGAVLAVREALSEGACRNHPHHQQRQRDRDGGGGTVFASPIPPQEGEDRPVVTGVDGDGPGSSGAHRRDEEEGGAGVGCRVGGCTVTALGSLRDRGAYCVVELAMPRRTGHGTISSGWSVAGVQFGTVEDGSDGEREEAKRKLAGGAAGNFVLNYG